MPPYDPKANRPKLVPVEDDAAPVDAILGPDASSPTKADVAAPEPARPKLSVVPPDGAATPPAAEVDAGSSPRFDAKTAIAVGVTVATVLGLIVAWRRRS